MDRFHLVGIHPFLYGEGLDIHRFPSQASLSWFEHIVSSMRSPEIAVKH
jgi:hypothetical protein